MHVISIQVPVTAGSVMRSTAADTGACCVMIKDTFHPCHVVSVQPAQYTLIDSTLLFMLSHVKLS